MNLQEIKLECVKLAATSNEPPHEWTKIAESLVAFVAATLPVAGHSESPALSTR